MAKGCSKFLKNIWSCSLSRLMYQKLCFSFIAILYISLSSLRLTNSSNSSSIVIYSFEFRSRQISIQQKFVRQMRETTLNFWVCSQQAQPRWRPRTNRLVRIFVELCITLSPCVGEVIDEHKNAISCFECFLLFQMCIDLFMPFDDLFQSIRFPFIPHSFSSSGTFISILTCLRHASQAGSTPGAQDGENTYTREYQLLYGPTNIDLAVVVFPTPLGPVSAPLRCGGG